MKKFIEHLILGHSTAYIIIMVVSAVIMLSGFIYGGFLISRGAMAIRRNRREKPKEDKATKPTEKENE